MQTKDTNQKEWLIEGYALESGWLWPRKGISTRTHRLCCSTEMSIIPYNWYISWNLSSSPMSPLMGLTRGRVSQIGSEAALITLADFGVVQYMLSFQPAHKHITTYHQPRLWRAELTWKRWIRWRSMFRASLYVDLVPKDGTIFHGLPSSKPT